MNIQTIQTRAKDVTELLKVLSSENRLMIVCQLSEGEKSVGELAELVGKKPAAVSQQLAILRRDRIVTSRRDAQTVYYDIGQSSIRELIGFLYETYCGGNEAEA